MKPTEKIANDLFQNLRTRFSPVTIGDENAEVTTDPATARFFSFVYQENGKKMGPVSISIINNRSLKIYYSHSMVNELKSSRNWYSFLKEMRFFSKQNLLSFDARDIQKDQLDTRDFDFIKQNDGPYKEEDVEITESAMYGSKRKSMQKFENATLVVYHKKTVDEEKRGSRSRHIDSIFIESNHERFRFPMNYLNGARAMAVHVSEGGTPYDAVGKHIIDTVTEMQNLAKFARMTKRHAMEDTEAADIRDRVVETYHGIKKDIMRMQNPKNYRNFAENFTPTDALGNADVTSLQEKFTRKIWNEKMNDLLPSVQRALESKKSKKVCENCNCEISNPATGCDCQHNNINEASPSVEKMIKDPNFVLLLKKDENADRMIRTTKFRKADGLLAFIMSDIASRLIGNAIDAVANFASQMAIDIGEEGASFGTKMTPEYKRDKQLATMLAQKYLGDIKRISTDPEYANTVRKDPADVYGKKKKRDGSYHEAVEAFESWANNVAEATTTGTVGTTGTSSPATASTNAQVVKALSGGDPAKARDIKRVSDKLARGQKLTPSEMPVAGEIAKGVVTTKKPNAAMQALAQDEYSDSDNEDFVVEKTLKVKPDNDSDLEDNDTRIGTIAVKTDSERKKRAHMHRNKMQSEEINDELDEDWNQDSGWHKPKVHTDQYGNVIKTKNVSKSLAKSAAKKSKEDSEEVKESADTELDLIADSLALLKKFAGI